MQAIPWPVSPEFKDALALATQRHLAQASTTPSTPQQRPSLEHHHSLNEVQPACTSGFQSSESIPRSSSLMMKTRVAVRDKTPHRFQVVPLRDVTPNREKSRTKLDSVKKSPVPWTRQLALHCPSGVGLGLNVPVIPDTPERGRQRTPRQNDMLGGTPLAQKGILRGLQGLSPKRQIGSPDHKENRMPSNSDNNRSPTKRERRRRGHTLDPARGISLFAREPTTIQDHLPSTPFQETTAHSTQENIAIGTPLVAISSWDEALDDKTKLAITENMLTVAVSNPSIRAAVARATGDAKTGHSTPSRHFKSPSLGTIHHLLTASTCTPDVPNNDAPRVRCRKRTNTLSAAHAGTKRYGVYTSGKIDFSPVVPQEDVDAHIGSTYSLDALLSAYSYDSLPSMYSQESFVTLSNRGYGTRPLHVKVRPLRTQATEGQPHPIVLQLVQDIDEAIVGWV
ncbi:hypothetical protein B0H12DRAFT_1089134 [Mycena haematopus]|nr:hypothetical protein B0H12DRAFT_1089134 [Mycena haematopus]